MKLIFVASDFSGLGKGTFSASLARVFKSHGVNTRIMKCDLYFNYDAGTINPGEHGEVYVLADGTETDQDFGIYERYSGMECNARDYLTSGQVYHQIFLNERAGKYLGQTVSVEHVIEEIKHRMLDFAEQCDLGIIELGATIGDIKGIYFLEACRQLRAELGKDDTLFILLSHFPYLNNVQELKTMGCQRSVNDLRSKGLKPDIIVARTVSHAEIPEYQLGKIQKFCEVPKGAVFCFPDLDDEYEIPRLIRSKLLHNYVSLRMGILLGEDTLDAWYRSFAQCTDLKVALVGKYPHSDAYVSIIHHLRFNGIRSVTYLSEPKDLDKYDAVILPGGWGERGVEEIIHAAQICREERIPCLGICLGLQLMVIEYARNVLGLKNANSIEFDENTSHPVVKLQDEQTGVNQIGGTSRLGNWTTILDERSRIAEIYGKTEIVQRHRHRYEIASNYDFKDFRVTGRDKRTGLIETMELRGHPFYIGVQYHPEFSPVKVPLFKALAEAALLRRQTVEKPGEASLLSHGTPGTYLENIDITDEMRLRAIILLTPEELKNQGITSQQRSILADFLRTFDEKRERMEVIENEIALFQSEMREINLKPNHIEGEPLSSEEQEKLIELQKKTDQKRQLLRNLRDEYEGQFLRYDEAMGSLRHDESSLPS